MKATSEWLIYELSKNWNLSLLYMSHNLTWQQIAKEVISREMTYPFRKETHFPNSVVIYNWERFLSHWMRAVTAFRWDMLVPARVVHEGCNLQFLSCLTPSRGCKPGRCDGGGPLLCEDGARGVVNMLGIKHAIRWWKWWWCGVKMVDVWWCCLVMMMMITTLPKIMISDWMIDRCMDTRMDEGKDGFMIMMMRNMMNLMMIDCLASNQG